MKPSTQSLAGPPTPGHLQCPFSGPPKPAGPRRQPQTTQDRLGVLTCLLDPPPLQQGSRTCALALPSSSRSLARTPPRCTPRICPTPSRPCLAELAQWGGSNWPPSRLGPGAGPLLKRYTPFFNTPPPPPQREWQRLALPQAHPPSPTGLSRTYKVEKGRRLSPAFLTWVTGSPVSGAANRQAVSILGWPKSFQAIGISGLMPDFCGLKADSKYRGPESGPLSSISSSAHQELSRHPILGPQGQQRIPLETPLHHFPKVCK